MKKATGILELSKQSHDVPGTFAVKEELLFKNRKSFCSQACESCLNIFMDKDLVLKTASQLDITA